MITGNVSKELEMVENEEITNLLDGENKKNN